MLDRCADEPSPSIGPGASAPSARSAVALFAVVLPAELDVLTAERVRSELQTALDLSYPVVIADMSRTYYCDCAAVAALLAAARYGARAGSQLRIVARARPVLRVFLLTGLAAEVPVYRTTSAAASLRAARRAASAARPRAVTQVRTDVC